MSTLLVDADVVAYQVSFASEEPIRWGEQDNEFAIWTLHSDELDCTRRIKDYEESHITIDVNNIPVSEVISKIINFLVTYDQND